MQHYLLVVKLWCDCPRGNNNSVKITANPKLNRPVYVIMLSDEFIPEVNSERSAWMHLPVRALQLRLVVVSGSLPDQCFPWQSLHPQC